MARAVSPSLSDAIAAKGVLLDPGQQAVADRLQALLGRLADWAVARNGLLGGLFKGRQAPPRGLYIHGRVGRGKSMLMDAFFSLASIAPKQRVHFHAFMADVHAAIAAARRDVPGDPIPHVATQIAARARVLCFDEFHVTDIADAMILGRLFQGLFAHDVVVVATSNVPPAGLYRDGLNRSLFEPFIAMLEAQLEVVELDAARDYRLDRLLGRPLYFTPLGPAADAALRKTFQRLTGVARGLPRDLDVNGRKVSLSEVAEGTAFVTFDELCMRPLGAQDYLQLAARCHTVMLAGVPLLDRDRRAEARRFITLIDTLYDAHTRLVISAAAEPDQLHPEGDQAFLFERTASRLMEMRSADYLEAAARYRARHTH